MELSPEARAARNRYQRELYRKRKESRAGQKQIQDMQERYWLKKAKAYAEQDAKATESVN
ncbi:MAG: hypothetical protein IKG57_06275 [Enterococcus sp.]|uniref:hypothetical protein n=1 Tax=Enterococcus sp. TaxID=35783 RepID=UPI00257F8D7D|nr:hypothetical protein [Enterococcus sp.]MBR3047766.1 hypothetical protein [Enterococcus sp.]